MTFNTGDRIVLVEACGDLSAGTPGWVDRPFDPTLPGDIGIIVRSGAILDVPATLLRAESVKLFTYRHKALIGYMLMPMPIWNFMRSAANNIDGQVEMWWSITYPSVGALMDSYHERPLSGVEISTLRHTIFEGTTLRVGVQPLYNALTDMREDEMPELVVEALERYERWCTYFKEQI